MLVDIHQHLWTEPLLDALAARDRLPFVRRADGIATVHCAGEQAWAVDLEAESPALRAELVHRDGLDRALVALSSPIGIEALPRDDARELIDAHLGGVAELPEEFGAWGPIGLDRPDPTDVDDLLARGCAGISLSAAALDGPAALDSAGPVLERAAEREVPVFVHPGPATGAAELGRPLWWAALTDYVAQMQAAWLAFITAGRREHPSLRVVFALLAGGAPLHAERLAARGGPPIELRDPLIFYDTSSYGPVAIASTASVVGAGQLVYGSDRPVLEPTRTGHDESLMANSAALLAAELASGVVPA